MCDVSGASTGAILSLNALGKQDTYLLSEKTDDSLFKYEEKRHSNFSRFHRTTTVYNPGGKLTWPFNERIKVTLNPQNAGDLLSNMYISLTLPALPSGRNYADQVGRHLIKSITMRVDEFELETIYDDWMIIYDELYLEMSEKITNKFLINRMLPYDTAVDTPQYAQYESDVIIPIPFSFRESMRVMNTTRTNQIARIFLYVRFINKSLNLKLNFIHKHSSRIRIQH